MNATKIYAVSIENEYDYEDLISNLESEFKKDSDYYHYGKKCPHELRSFPCKSLGSFSGTYVTDEQVTHEFFVTPVIRRGYYGGCNLDWFVLYYIDCMEHEVHESESAVQRSINEYVETIENVFAMHSNQLNVFGTFSNGEAIYSKV